MSSVSKNSKISLGKTPRRRRTSTCQRRFRKAKRSTINGGRTCFSKSKVSEKLEALKNLIPANNGETVKAEQLFQETADYIVLLRTQVFVLQRLIEFYGSTTQPDNNINNAAVS
ncbi:hypothetical protein JCGZ_19930 [Jatropha curcas]|uniref:BHLH domain-containing protein n=1 Tax=Jatropha curcas TaxID=180498 RepID=A0A067JTG6_JATCU|nr:hypothetical protein JCGZ_19930 [Jatropha curcas]